jgi:hypothetical protein
MRSLEHHDLLDVLVDFSTFSSTSCARMVSPCIATLVKSPLPIVFSSSPPAPKTTTRLLPVSATTSSSKAEHATPQGQLSTPTPMWRTNYAVISTVGDCDVAVPGHEVQSLWAQQLTVAAASRPEVTKKSAVTAPEHTDAVGMFGSLRHHDDGIIGTHASRILELTHAHEAVEVKGRRQHLHAVVAVLRHEHEVVGCYPHLAWIAEPYRSVARTAADSQPQAVTDTEHVDGVRVAITVRHQQRRAVAAHRHTVVERLHTGRVDDAAHDASQRGTAEEASHGAAVHAAQ